MFRYAALEGFDGERERPKIRTEKRDTKSAGGALIAQGGKIEQEYLD